MCLKSKIQRTNIHGLRTIYLTRNPHDITSTYRFIYITCETLVIATKK